MIVRMGFTIYIFSKNIGASIKIHNSYDSCFPSLSKIQDKNYNCI